MGSNNFPSEAPYIFKSSYNKCDFNKAGVILCGGRLFGYARVICLIKHGLEDSGTTNTLKSQLLSTSQETETKSRTEKASSVNSGPCGTPPST